jgi:hypothetical protein
MSWVVITPLIEALPPAKYHVQPVGAVGAKPPLFQGGSYTGCYVKGQNPGTKGKDCTSPLPLKSYLA